MSNTSGSGFGLLPIIKRKRNPFFEGEYKGLDETRSVLRNQTGSAAGRKQEDGPGRGEVPIGKFGPQDEEQDKDLKPAPIGMAKIDGSKPKVATVPPPQTIPLERSDIPPEGMAQIIPKAPPEGTQATPQARFEALMAKAKPIETTETKDPNDKQSAAPSTGNPDVGGKPSGRDANNQGTRRTPARGNPAPKSQNGDQPKGTKLDAGRGKPASPPSPIK